MRTGKNIREIRLAPPGPGGRSASRGASRGARVSVRPASWGLRLRLAGVVVLAVAAGMTGLPGTAKTVRAESVATTARQVLLVDLASDRVLMEKNASSRLHPASMTKIMTSYIVFGYLQEGTLKWSDTFVVSEKARRMGGSRMFLEQHSRVSVMELLRGVIVQSGNDASVALAEGLAGSEEKFVALMNKKARELGLHDTQFKNASGWPEEGHYSTARDIVKLSQHTIENFPDYYALFSEPAFTHNNIRQENRNNLLKLTDIHVDGLKTGYTEASGYGLVATALQDERRVLLFVHGLPSSRERRSEAARLIRLGLHHWHYRRYYAAEDVVLELPVYLSPVKTVRLKTPQSIDLSISVLERHDLSVYVEHEMPLTAPIARHTPLGDLVFETPAGELKRFPLVAAESVPEHSFLGRAGSTLAYFMTGSLGGLVLDSLDSDDKAAAAASGEKILGSVAAPVPRLD